MSILDKFKKEKDSHYISTKELNKTIKENIKITKEFEKNKKRKNVQEEEYLTQMKDPNNIIEFDNLHTYFYTDAGVVKAVNGVSFSIPKGTIVGVVGESGCGKSVTSLSLMQLVQAPQGQIVEGTIRYNSGEKVYDIAKMPLTEMTKIRGKDISMIFQEPMTSLNPVFTVGNQLDEMTALHSKETLLLKENERRKVNYDEKIQKIKEKAELENKEAVYPEFKPLTKLSFKKAMKLSKDRSIELLDIVGIANPERVYDNFPHELSGGMRQRVMIAMALACNPKLIIADEPTTALDVTIQAQILELLREVKQKINGSIMLITHDLGVIAEMVDYVVVMYAGKVIERGTVYEIFENPIHPYTIGLQKSKPSLNKKVDRLYSIPGQVPNPINMPNHCYFKDRCDKCFAKCSGEYPELIKVTDTHYVACHLCSKEEVHGK